ncbi:hypothetical protein GXW82_08695 [Streptacidiphilus sp. 4-A2]|nr:hypothetical protein [Streptacidiphilus sp. 4-A2]
MSEEQYGGGFGEQWEPPAPGSAYPGNQAGGQGTAPTTPPGYIRSSVGPSPDCG